MAKVGVFVDVNSIYFHVNKKYPNRKLDYGTFLTKIVGDDTLQRAIAYGSQANKEAVAFISCLQHMGFETKYGKLRTDWNIGMSMDIVRVIDKIDVAVIGSNSIDLLPTIQWVRDRGVKCVIVCANLCTELREAADRYCEVEEDMLCTIT